MAIFLEGAYIGGCGTGIKNEGGYINAEGATIENCGVGVDSSGDSLTVLNGAKIINNKIGVIDSAAENLTLKNPSRKQSLLSSVAETSGTFIGAVIKQQI